MNRKSRLQLAVIMDGPLTGAQGQQAIYDAALPEIQRKWPHDVIERGDALFVDMLRADAYLPDEEP